MIHIMHNSTYNVLNDFLQMVSKFYTNVKVIEDFGL